jgi:hypothetical protein
MRLKLNLAVVLTALIVGVGAAFGGVIKTWSAGQILTPTDLNANFAHIHNNMVGGHGARLVDADVSATAAIATTKLAAGALIPKAWVAVTSTCSAGTCTMADSSGMTSCVFNSTGNYTCTLSSARPATSYMAVASGLSSTTAGDFCSATVLSTTTFGVICYRVGTGVTNMPFHALVMDN